MCTAPQGNAANQKKGVELKYLHNEQFYRRRSSPCKHWLYPTLLLTNSTRLDPDISTFRESLKAFYGSLHLVQNDVLQVEYAAEGGQRQHQGPAGEQHLGVPGDPVLGCAGSCKDKERGSVTVPTLSPPHSQCAWIILSCLSGQQKNSSEKQRKRCERGPALLPPRPGNIPACSKRRNCF